MSLPMKIKHDPVWCSHPRNRHCGGCCLPRDPVHRLLGGHSRLNGPDSGSHLVPKMSSRGIYYGLAAPTMAVLVFAHLRFAVGQTRHGCQSDRYWLVCIDLYSGEYRCRQGGLAKKTSGATPSRTIWCCGSALPDVVYGPVLQFLAGGQPALHRRLVLAGYSLFAYRLVRASDPQREEQHQRTRVPFHWPEAPRVDWPNRQHGTACGCILDLDANRIETKDDLAVDHPLRRIDEELALLPFTLTSLIGLAPKLMRTSSSKPIGA